MGRHRSGLFLLAFFSFSVEVHLWPRFAFVYICIHPTKRVACVDQLTAKTTDIEGQESLPDESEINLATGEADPEFAEWKWANPEEVIEQVDGTRILYLI
ncbi:hypothetical protein SLEP1_g54330 [Rubroshorea leprosula]|uniref:Uncharacterized protein n=1 Tax=Rubroshorea leprosula TaxID=152421 RepID=A0AAV5MF02_9ROSI|nr:hypothetical protein SLEP1_g54330 [Rubroshorea leprosula]